MKWMKQIKADMEIEEIKDVSVISGRVITNFDGVELFSIKPQEGMYPVEADAMTHFIAELINASPKKFADYYKEYMER